MDLIDKNQATQIAQAYVKNLGADETADKSVLIDMATIEKPYGWLFFSKSHTEVATADRAPTQEENVPFLVERAGGAIHVFDTAHSVAENIAAYEREHTMLPPTLPDISTLTAGSHFAPVAVTTQLKRSQQWFIAGITSALLVALSALLFGWYGQAQTTSTHIAGTATSAAAVSQRQVQATQAAVASATAIVVAAHSPYHAAIPGLYCDTGPGNWTTLTDTNVSCANGKLQMSPVSSQYIGEEEFNWIYPLDFPTNTSVEATIQPMNDCGGILLRMQSDSLGWYAFFICSGNGYWDIYRFDATSGKVITLADNYVSVHQSYDMKATAIGTTLTLSIDGNIVAHVTDATFSTTDYVALAVGATNETGPVYFSDFTFTPLSNSP